MNTDKGSAQLRLLGEFIAASRKAAGLTQTEFGEAIGKKRATVARLEAGDRERLPSDELLGQIVAALNVTREDLDAAIHGDQEEDAFDRLIAARRAVEAALGDMDEFLSQVPQLEQARQRGSEALRRLDIAIAADTESAGYAASVKYVRSVPAKDPEDAGLSDEASRQAAAERAQRRLAKLLDGDDDPEGLADLFSTLSAALAQRSESASEPARKPA